ncbi:MAG: hypothetical protein ABSA84_05925 [Gammaproteobacteria bacterium]|jgi:hypothetical protein
MNGGRSWGGGASNFTGSFFNLNVPSSSSSRPSFNNNPGPLLRNFSANTHSGGFISPSIQSPFRAPSIAPVFTAPPRVAPAIVTPIVTQQQPPVVVPQQPVVTVKTKPPAAQQPASSPPLKTNSDKATASCGNVTAIVSSKGETLEVIVNGSVTQHDIDTAISRANAIAAKSPVANNIIATTQSVNTMDNPVGSYSSSNVDFSDVPNKIKLGVAKGALLNGLPGAVAHGVVEGVAATFDAVDKAVISNKQKRAFDKMEQSYKEDPHTDSNKLSAAALVGGMTGGIAGAGVQVLKKAASNSVYYTANSIADAVTNFSSSSDTCKLNLITVGKNVLGTTGAFAVTGFPNPVTMIENGIVGVGFGTITGLYEAHKEQQLCLKKLEEQNQSTSSETLSSSSAPRFNL